MIQTQISRLLVHCKGMASTELSANFGNSKQIRAINAAASVTVLAGLKSA